MHAVSPCLRKYGLRYDDLYDPYHHLDIKEALARRPTEDRELQADGLLRTELAVVRREAVGHARIYRSELLLVQTGHSIASSASTTLSRILHADLCKDSEKSIDDLKGKELLRRLHEVGTFVQITSIQGDQVVLLGHRRLQITEMVQEDPLTVKVDHLKEMPFNKDDDIIKATSFEVISTLREVLRTSSIWKDHVQTYTQHMGDFNYPRLADFGAAIFGANKLLCQEVLEELAQSIAKAIEEKISGDHRRYLLNEQLKAIKKVWLQTDKAAVSPEAVLLQQPA